MIGQEDYQAKWEALMLIMLTRSWNSNQSIVQILFVSDVEVVLCDLVKLIVRSPVTISWSKR